MSVRTDDAPQEPCGRLGPYRLLTPWDPRQFAPTRAAEPARAAVYIGSAEGRRVLVKHYAEGVELDTRVLRRLQLRADDAIRHVNLAPIEDFGVDEDGRAWTASTWLRGDPLRLALDALAEGTPGQPSLSPLAAGPGGERHPAYIVRTVELLREVAEGLELAAEADLVHGNLSPSNLVFAPTGRLVVTDFGAPIDPEQASALPYRAPELLLETPVLSPRADVYSLGAILYECLTLQPPFANRGPALEAADESVDPRAQFRRIRAGKLARPRSIREEIPHALEECLLCSLSVEPGDRYSSPGRFAEDLGRFLRGESPSAARSLGVRLELDSLGRRDWRRPGRWIAALFLVALLALAIHLGGDARDLAERKELESRALTAWNLGQASEAMEHADRLVGLAPDDPTARALRELLEETIASERRRAQEIETAESRIVHANAREEAAQVAFASLALAVSSLEGGDAAQALESLRAAREQLPDPRIEQLEIELRRRLATDPLERDLADPRVAVRVSALEDLARMLAAGDRPPRDVRLAARGLASHEEPERLAALRVYRWSSTEALLRDLAGGNSADDGDRVVLSAKELETLFDTLLAIGDDEARRLFASLPFARIRAIGGAHRDEVVDVTARLAVRARAELPTASGTRTRNASRGEDEGVQLARAWIDSVSRIDPEHFLDAAGEIFSEPSFSRDLARALERIEEPRADEWLARIALDRPLEAGVDAVDALAHRDDATPLLGLLEKATRLAEPLRIHAYRQLGELHAGEPTARRHLVRTVISHPEPRLRELSIRALAATPTSTDRSLGAREAVVAALTEASLRPSALEWLHGMDAALKRRIALDLLSHRDATLRDGAVEILGHACGEDTVLPLLAALGDHSSAVRRSALEALSRQSHSESFSRFAAELARAMSSAIDDSASTRFESLRGEVGSPDGGRESEGRGEALEATEQIRQGLERLRDRLRSLEGAPAPILPAEDELSESAND